MQEKFLELVQLSLTSSLVALAVMLIRLVFRKAPKWIFCLLWGLVALRLLLPVSIESEFSLVPDKLASGQILANVGDSYVGDVQIIYENNTGYADAVQAGREPVNSNNGYYVVTEKDSYAAPPTVEETIYPILSWVWLAGMVLMLTYAVVSYLALKRKMEEATLLYGNIWQCEQVDSPFVLGIIQPRIYLPYQISGFDMENVIAHEQAHIRRKDHWWKPIGFLLLSVHWFNPVMWLAYILLCRDIEAACDEKVIKNMTKEQMHAYSTALFHCSVHRRRIAACPLAFGETGVKERIKYVMNYKKPAFWIIVLAVAAAITVGVLLLTDPKADITLIEETYEYSAKSGNYVQPAVVDGWAVKDALTATTEDGTFFCFTSDTAQADGFINSQRTLLCFLRDHGVEIEEMDYYGTDYGYSFSDSKAASVALSSVQSWQQILVRLQALWGDYTDYGYIYAMANAIAEELGWQADSTPVIKKASMDTFFKENPEAVHLLYPTFTTDFASQETVEHCKALANQLFRGINWRKSLAKPIEDQLYAYYSKVSGYAKKLGIPFTRQRCGYAYYGKNVPLRIRTTYAELLVDDEYTDVKPIYGDYFSHYTSIYETANNINAELTAAVQYFGLEKEAGVVKIKFLDSKDTNTQRFLRGRGIYWASTNTIYVTSLWPYMSEYYLHIEYLLKQRNDSVWQTTAFCELGASYSIYDTYMWEHTFTQNEQAKELFYACTGRAYQPGRDDFFEAMDILCYIGDYYLLEGTGAEAKISITRYLSDLYSEDVVCDLYLYPETVEEVTGKTWEALAAEWEQHIRNKYAGVKIPDGISS